MKKTASVMAVTLLMASLLSSCADKKPEDKKKEEPGKNVKISSVWDCSSIGMLDFMNNETAASAAGDNGGTHYKFLQFYGSNLVEDSLVSGECDMAVLPVDQALNAYVRSNSSVRIVDINSLSELYVLTNDQSLNTLEDLEGKDIWISDTDTDTSIFSDLVYQKDLNVTVSKKERQICIDQIEASKDPVICVLPDPYATELILHEEKVKQICSVNEEWEKETGSLAIDTVSLARTDLIKSDPEAVKGYLEKHKASVEAIRNDPEKTKDAIGLKDIVRDLDTAKKKVSENRNVCISGADMKEKVSDYLETIDDDRLKDISVDDLFYIP